VSSEDFIENVVKTHSFVISLSCSEALQSGVSTCMAHGLIPIVTPETGFDDTPNAIICKDFHLDNVIKVVLDASEMEPEVLSGMEKCVFAYTRQYFSTSAVSGEFRDIMNSILCKYEDINHNDLL
jgi:hypothetical protein